MDPKVDAYIARSQKWPQEMAALQAILLDCGLAEDIKWGKPCYAHDGSNVAIMQEMNDFLSLMFFKGALMKDPAKVLRSQGANSRSALRMEFGSVDEITDSADTLRAYVADAIRVEESGLEVGPPPELVLAEELAERLNGDPALKAAFEALTPGRRREYNLYVTDAKQSSTRAARVEKFVPQILAGKGMRER